MHYREGRKKEGRSEEEEEEERREIRVRVQG